MKNFGIKIIVFLFLITLSNEIFCGTTNLKDYGKNLNFDFGGDKYNVYNSIPGYKGKVRRDIFNAFNIVWNEFTNNGASKAYRKYGKGHILMIAVPLEFKSGIEHMAQLLLNTITTFSLDIYTGSDLTRLLPLELSLKNESSEAATLKIKTFLPYGVEAFDFKPEPEEGEELKWTITIPAVSTETISYWLKLPDQVNSFEIKTELYEEETKLDEVSTTFEVIQTVLFRINELILELDMTGAVGKDAQLVSKAKHHLEQIRNRTGNSFIEHLLNLIDSVKAAAYLGEVKSVDVSAQRLKTGDIMVIMGFRFYGAVKTWGEVQLNSILEFL
jgi:hypothetical protein